MIDYLRSLFAFADILMPVSWIVMFILGWLVCHYGHKRREAILRGRSS